ncbi:hypothetical protein [Pseudonocardia sp. T1-2H]|uniref:hypothetical protein n=1 Tax=Pseudonocardia sp. T1-2H TaxID=3128899 RepID=UPI0031011562
MWTGPFVRAVQHPDREAQQRAAGLVVRPVAAVRRGDGPRPGSGGTVAAAGLTAGLVGFLAAMSVPRPARCSTGCCPGPQPEQWTPARIQQRAVATAVLSIDDHAERLRGWHVKHEAALWWWDQLTTLGYDITPAEAEHRAATQAAYTAEQAARAAEQAARAAAEDNEDEDQEDEDQEDEPGADETGQDSEHDAPAA